ncbi:hypothetical protein E2I00_001086, partial [Balaenoptera physalus]
ECVHRKSHQECPGKTGGRGRPRQARRHKTCPSPREISKVMASMALGMLNEGGCSEDDLLEKCIQSFDSAGSLRRGDHILNMVLAMHSWVLPSAHFAARLLTLYPPGAMSSGWRAEGRDERAWWGRGSTQELRRLQICHLVRYWLTQHPETVHQEPQLEEVIGLGKKRKVSLLFDHLETEELAEHLTYLEFRSFQAITRLLQLQNFNTLMAVTGGLCHSAISRLKDSYTHLSPDSTKDLVSLHEAQPDRLPDGRLHLPKLNSLYLRLQELATLQRQHPPCNANEDLLHLLTLSLDLFHTEDEIYELSYAREPRCPKSLPPSPFKVPLVVEWAPGVTPKPDRSVFKNYDPEGRGTISQEDFERLSGNFPFACRGLHPPPRQGSGSFSREELTGYLLQASAICTKLGLAFLHTFQEVTFRKPTFCGSCSGFLWGVTKQGYRCRGERGMDCGLCCHKHCRDQVKEECKKRPGAKGDVSPPEAPVPPTPVPHAGCGSEDNLSYTLSLEPETGWHVCHAWTQTEPSHPSWEPE